MGVSSVLFIVQPQIKPAFPIQGNISIAIVSKTMCSVNTPACLRIWVAGSCARKRPFRQVEHAVGQGVSEEGPVLRRFFTQRRRILAFHVATGLMGVAPPGARSKAGLLPLA